MAADLQQRHLPPNGVNGRTPGSEIFTLEWMRRTGRQARLAHGLRAFKLEQVTAPPPAPGHLRAADAAAAELVGAWLHAFDVEAIPDEAGHRTPESVQRMLNEGTVHLWEVDGRAVSLVNYGRPLVTGISIAPVYTPPDERGKGYASNAVAGLSQKLLDQGYAFVSLFTDLANPTSNKIYQQVGYRPVCDYADYVFEGESGAPA